MKPSDRWRLEYGWLEPWEYEDTLPSRDELFDLCDLPKEENIDTDENL